MTKEEILNRFNISEKELCSLVKPASHEVLFLSGSLFDGLGNTRSDLDLFLITDDSHRLLQSERTIDQNVVIGNKRYDLSIFSVSLVDETACILSQLEFLDPDFYVPRQLHPQVSNYEICTMIHRLRIGASIFNHELFAKILERFPFETYRQWLMRIKLNEYDGLYEDIVGSIESEDLLTAEELIQQQLSIVCQLLILSSGETFDRDKWVPRKLKHVVDKGFISNHIFEEFITTKRSLVSCQKNEILNAIQFCERQIEALQISLI